MPDIKPKADVLIEVSYEIVSKLGGIHSVIKTKAPYMKKYYKNNYIVVGLYIKRDARNKFTKKKPSQELHSLFDSLKKENIICRYGIWNAKGHPFTILIDVEKLKRSIKTKEKIMHDYWVHFLPNDNYHNNSLLFGYSAGKLISRLVKLPYFKKKKVVVHAHEYMSGLALLYLRKHKANLPLVFTTHATSLGRGIAFQGENLYKDMMLYKKNKGVYYKRLHEYKKKVGNVLFNRHLFEKACAKKADVFTAVSRTTSREASFLLDRPADIVTPNGLDIGTPPPIEEQLAINYRAKQKVLKFLDAFFQPYYKIDKAKALLFYTAGRYEIYTKGYDLFFEALKKLNETLKKENCQKEIFVFLFILMGKKKIKKGILRSLKRVKQKLRQAKSGKYPPNCLFKSRENVISLYLKKNRLVNRPRDKVKVIFYPAPVRKNDRLLSMHYKEVVSSMDLGIFPSLYEPWGYTPLETAALGTIAVTTDISGFGQFILHRTDQRKSPGIVVLRTKKRKKAQIVDNLEKIMHEVAGMSKEKKIAKRVNAHSLAGLANWEDFSKEYIKAHNLALKKHPT